MRQRRHHDGAIPFAGARDQVGQVVGHHKRHLAVRENARLGAPSGAGGVEIPERVIGRHHFRLGPLAQVLRHQAFVAERVRQIAADGNHQAKRIRGVAHRRHMLRKSRFTDHHRGATGSAQIRHFGWRQTKIGGDPDATQAKRRPAAFEHGQVVARLQQNFVALAHALGAQGSHQGIDALVNLRPRPGLIALNEARKLRKQLGRVLEQAAQVHHLGCAHAASSTLRKLATAAPPMLNTAPS